MYGGTVMSESDSTDDPSDYFTKYADMTVGLFIMIEGTTVITEAGTLEEMYQAFRERMIEEMNSE
jgi:hypothetical protein